MKPSSTGRAIRVIPRSRVFSPRPQKDQSLTEGRLRVVVRIALDWREAHEINRNAPPRAAFTEER